MRTSKDAITAVNRIVRQNLAEQLAEGIDLRDWEAEDVAALCREHLALQASLKEVLDAIPSIRATADPFRLQVVRNARRLITR